jgi:aromatic-L-amino-acid decarboxylase
MTDEAPDINAPSLLDPADWEAFREDAHRALDVALEFVRQRPLEPVWRELPEQIKALDQALPVNGSPLSELIEELEEQVLPYTLGNTHPRFWGWVHGSGTASGIVSQIMIGAINANMAGRDHAPIYVEAQVVRWMSQIFGFPEASSGIVCTGTSTATLLGLAAARRRVAGSAVRSRGNGDLRLVAYTSAQCHVSICKAVELMGLGADSLRSVPVLDDFSMDCAELEQMITADLALGFTPFAVVSVVGTVNTGAIDDLAQITRLCRAKGIWHHVDGAFGALGVLSEALKSRFVDISEADSLAFDFHKWMHVGYAAGCLLVRDGKLLRETFDSSPAYLQPETRGLAAGAPWPSDHGIELSRGFAALGVWFQLKEMGVARLGQAIHRNCLQAQWLGEAVRADVSLELMAPVTLNIVCFRRMAANYSPAQLDQLNRQIVIELQCRGIAAPSATELRGAAVIRVCITNHRTRQSDLEALLIGVAEISAQLCAEAP